MVHYPATFGYRRKSTVLPPSLQSSLKRLGEDMKQGRPGPADVAAVVDGLCGLPVKDFGAAYSDIAVCGGMYTDMKGQPWGWRPGQGWAQVAQSLMAQAAGLEFILLFHGSGYLRQAALEKIDGPVEAPFLLAAIIYRLNDWVPQVRQAAVEATLHAFATTSAPVILPAIVGMLGMRHHWKRGVREALIVDEIMSRSDVRAAMMSYLLQTPSGPVARTLRHLLRDSRFDTALPELARRARHPAVRQLALESLVRCQARWATGTTIEWIDKSMGLSRRVVAFESRPIDVDIPFEQLVRQGATDRSAAVRKVAMQAIIDRPRSWVGFDDLIAILARDSSAAIREGMSYLARQRAGN